MSTHGEEIQMSTHSKGFCEEKIKIVFQLSSNRHFISSSAYLPSLSRITRKPVLGVSDQVLHKHGCTAIEDG